MVTDSPQLKCMTKEELIVYFKTEMTKIKRQHDLAIHENTEEIFSLKRELLREKSSSPLNFRKDKDFELLMKKIPVILSKLDVIISEKENSSIIHNDHATLNNLKERIDTLFFENQRLQGLLKDKTKEARGFASQVSDADNQIARYSSIEAKFVKQIDKLQSDVENVKIETVVRDEINKAVLKELVGELKSDMACLEMMTKVEHDICSMIYREAVSDSLLEKENVLSSEIEENMRLKLEITSLSILMKEMEKLNILSDRVSEQEIYISKSKRESDLMKGRLGEALKQIHQYEVEMSQVSQILKTLSKALEEVEKQETILRGDIQEKQKALASAIRKEKEQRKLMETIISSMIMLSEAIVECECKLTKNIKTNESRLNLMSHQCIQLVQKANLLKRKEFWYKERFERRCSDLQKAETEVDLLGDEVDTLLSLLEKIYIALDHYSDVLQHYPGVVEILRLISREVKGKDTV